MQLLQVRLVGIGPFEDATLRFNDASGAPRKLALVLGAGGVGKTSLLGSIASTRPGSAVPPRPRAGPIGAAGPSFVVCDWKLGDDDPARPHALRVASPNAVLDENEEDALLRRREQALFERRAQEGGFVVIGFSAARTFPRSPVVYGPSDRVAVQRYDVRAPIVFDDVGRADLARETKHALGLAAFGATLGGSGSLDRALRAVTAHLAPLSGASYAGVDPTSLEPVFETPHRARVPFDELPTSARTLLAFGVLTARALHAAYPGRAPQEGEAVVLIDEIELHQEPSIARGVVPALRAFFPRVQWIVSTSSPQVALACDSGDVLALRRMPPSSGVEVHEGPLAVIH